MNANIEDTVKMLNISWFLVDTVKRKKIDPNEVLGKP